MVIYMIFVRACHRRHDAMISDDYEIDWNDCEWSRDYQCLLDILDDMAEKRYGDISLECCSFQWSDDDGEHHYSI